MPDTWPKPLPWPHGTRVDHRTTPATTPARPPAGSRSPTPSPPPPPPAPRAVTPHAEAPETTAEASWVCHQLGLDPATVARYTGTVPDLEPDVSRADVLAALKLTQSEIVALLKLMEKTE
jgi:hypothetical protein